MYFPIVRASNRPHKT